MPLESELVATMLDTVIIISTFIATIKGRYRVSVSQMFSQTFMRSCFQVSESKCNLLIDFLVIWLDQRPRLCAVPCPECG